MSTEQKEQTPPPTRGTPVDLDRRRYLRYTLGTLRKIREEFGEEALSKGITESKIAKILWYGLVGDDPELKPEAIEDLVDLRDLPALNKALSTAMGGKAKLETDPQQPAASDAPVG